MRTKNAALLTEGPEGKTLACKVIGNAVPPLMYQKIIAPIARYLENHRETK